MPNSAYSGGSETGRLRRANSTLDIAPNTLAYTFAQMGLPPLDVHVSRLRYRIEADPKEPELIKTVRNEGYVFTAPVTLNGAAW